MAKSKKKSNSSTIALNKKARHDFFIEDRFEAGLVLQGWEVKSLREGRVQLSDAYVFVKGRERALWPFSLTGSDSTAVGLVVTLIKQ